jgi:aquaporin TIP
LSITMGILVAGPLTGAALNPARWFGPAIVNGQMSQAIVYLVGPLLGGALAGIAYPMLFGEKSEASA